MFKVLLASMVLLADAFRCINFFGLETEKHDFTCSWVHTPRYYLEQLQGELDITVTRVPVSYQYIQDGDWMELDHYFGVSEELGLGIILDMHRIWDTHQSAIPEDGIDVFEFARAWKLLLTRYHSSKALVGVDIFNEIQNSDYHYTNYVYNEVLKSIGGHSNITYYLGCHSWGNNCTGIHVGPHRLDIHVYPWSQTWEVPENALIGEFGFKDLQWGKDFYRNYSRSRDWCYWTIANSYDTDTLWEPDCMTRNQEQWAILSG